MSSKQLRRAWRTPRARLLTVVNNSYIGVFYIAAAFLFFVLAGILALVMRTQLAVPDNTLVGPTLYSQLFTMHGTMMMFLFAVPAVEAMGVLLLPNMLAARDLPFPRLSAYAFWAYFFGGLAFFASIFFGLAPTGGWFMYPPLTDAKYSPGINEDFWLLGIGFIEISAIAGAIEIIVGVLRTRAPGMTLDRMPVFAWAMLVFAGMIVFAFPAIIVATALLELERAFDWPFLRRRARRRSAAVAAPVLVLRASRRLHHLPACGGNGLDDRGDDGPHTAGRLPPRRAGDDRNGLPELRAVGPSHVPDGHPAHVARLLLRGEHGGRDPERHPGLRVDRHAGRGQGAVRRRRSSFWASCSSSCSAA